MIGFRRTGYSNVIISYSFNDKDVQAGVYYYQLAQYDLSGEVVMSEIVTLVRNAQVTENLHLSPVPALDNVLVEFSSEDNMPATVVIYDIAGKNIAIHDIVAVKGINSIHLSIESLAAGTYILQLQLAGRAYTERLVKK